MSKALLPDRVTRRALLGGTLASGACLLVGCSPAGGEQRASKREAAAPATAAAASAVAMTVFKDPNCGCCEKWAGIARQAGYNVVVRDDPDMRGVKRRLGVPEELGSCHTVQVGGLVVEGHVPLDAIARAIQEKPQGLKGLAVPGMPAGSPGMELPNGRKDPFQVIAFFADGRTSVYQA